MGYDLFEFYKQTPVNGIILHILLLYKFSEVQAINYHYYLQHYLNKNIKNIEMHGGKIAVFFSLKGAIWQRHGLSRFMQKVKGKV